MSELYLDRDGIAFEDYHHHMPPGLWMSRTVKKDQAGSQQQFHAVWGLATCWMCDRPPKQYDPNPGKRKHQLHHLFAGSRGRSHQRIFYCWACYDCHENRVREEDLGRWLWLKWYFDPEWTDWCKLAARHGRFLPDLDPPEKVAMR